MDEPLRISRRRLPHWRMSGSTYFVTFRLLYGEMTPDARRLVLNHIRAGVGRFYALIAVVVMPDHVHVILRPLENVELARIMKGIKGVTARMINQHRGTNGSIWQDESWDRILRDQDELDEKLEYMLNNPVKRNLIDDGWRWDGWNCNTEVA